MASIDSYRRLAELGGATQFTIPGYKKLKKKLDDAKGTKPPCDCVPCRAARAQGDPPPIGSSDAKPYRPIIDVMYATVPQPPKAP